MMGKRLFAQLYLLFFTVSSIRFLLILIYHKEFALKVKACALGLALCNGFLENFNAWKRGKNRYFSKNANPISVG